MALFSFTTGFRLCSKPARGHTLPTAVLAGAFLMMYGAICAEPSESAGTQALPVKTVQLFDPFSEWQIVYPGVWSNKFDVKAAATFTHAGSGQTRQTPMFYDGEDTWKFRFTGTRIGTWTFETTGPGALGGRTGTVEVIPNEDPEAHGFMTTLPHPQGARWGFETAGGTDVVFSPQYVMGKPPSSYVGADGQVLTRKIERDVQEFVVEHGFIGFHIPLLPIHRQLKLGDQEEPPQDEIAQAWLNETWLGDQNPDPQVYHALEHVLLEVQKEGGAVHLWAWGTGAWGRTLTPEHQLGGHLSEEHKRNMRYLAARLGAIPGWSLGFGYDGEDNHSDDSGNGEWLSPKGYTDWKNYVESQLGWDHLLGARECIEDTEAKDENCWWLGGDYVGYANAHVGYDTYVQDLNHRPQTLSFEEDRFRIWDYGYEPHTAQETRRGLWNAAMAGGVAGIWGMLYPTTDEGGSRPYTPGNTPGGENVKQWIRTHFAFFEERLSKDLYRTGELSAKERTRVLRSEDRSRYLFYVQDANSVTMNLSGMPGAQNAVVVDAKSSYREESVGTIRPEKHTLDFDYTSDWAIAVGDFGEDAAAPTPETDP